MRTTEQTEIDGHAYACTMMSVRTANATFNLLLRTLGRPVIQALARAQETQNTDQTAMMMAAISMAMQNLDEDVSERLIERIFNGVRVRDVGDLVPWDDKFEDHFHGRLLSMYKVWAWAIQVNYQSFLDAAQAHGLSGLLDLGKSSLQNLQTSTDESGTSSTQNPRAQH